MNVQINKLVRSLLQKESIEQCTLHELQELARRYPYFGAAQLLLAKKLSMGSDGKPDDETGYREQLQKTSLFFHDPLWLEHLLNDTGNADLIEGKKSQENRVEQKNTAFTDIPDDNRDRQQDIITEPVEEQTPALPEVYTEPAIAVKEPDPVRISPDPKIEPADPSKTEMLFEPFHTVDYFASQGIKFKEEEQPKDKLGKQLKSFTEWLKTMKRLPISELAKTEEPQIVQKVEQLAAHSLQDREVITETMAEVWEKQGNAAKAIEIYTKLSLSEPSKSAYFAAKIERLKKIN